MKVKPEKYLLRIFEFLGLGPKDVAKVNLQKRLNTANLNLTLKAKRLYNIFFTKTRENLRGLLSLPPGINQPLFNSISFLERQLEQKFQEKLNEKQIKIIKKALSGVYAQSNRKTSELIDINLSLYGYEL
jgi:hypothetical protein